MYTITLMDRNDSGMLSIGLLDLLEAVKPALGQVEWLVRSLEVLGEGANDFYDIELRGARLRTSELEELAARLDQVIDGEFSAYEERGGSPILILRAVDSSSWDISTNKEPLLERARSRFKRIHEVGNVA
jgi:hypothetical protein